MKYFYGLFLQRNNNLHGTFMQSPSPKLTGLSSVIIVVHEA